MLSCLSPELCLSPEVSSGTVIPGDIGFAHIVLISELTSGHLVVGRQRGTDGFALRHSQL